MTTNDTYEAGLIAAMNALDALSETYLAEARANNMATVGEDNYNADLGHAPHPPLRRDLPGPGDAKAGRPAKRAGSRLHFPGSSPRPFKGTPTSEVLSSTEGRLLESAVWVSSSPSAPVKCWCAGTTGSSEVSRAGARIYEPAEREQC